MTVENLDGRELLRRAADILGSQGLAAWDSLAADIRTHLETPPARADGPEGGEPQQVAELRAVCKLMQAGWEDANQRIQYERQLNARAESQITQLRAQLAAHAAAEVATKTASWNHIAPEDLDRAEQFLLSHEYSFMLPRDDSTLKNISLHCIREVRASRAEIARLKDALEARLDRWISIQDERPTEADGDLICFTGTGYAVATLCEGNAWLDKRAERVTPTHFIRLTPPGAQRAKAADLPAERSVAIEKDIFGTVHLKLGDFDFIQIQYQYPYTDNASQNRLAKRIQELLDPFTRTAIEQLTIERDQFRELARANAQALEQTRQAVTNE